MKIRRSKNFEKVKALVGDKPFIILDLLELFSRGTARTHLNSWTMQGRIKVTTRQRTGRPGNAFNVYEIK